MSITFNVKVLTSKLQKIQKKLAQVPKEAFNEFVKETPIRSGNARRKTKLRGQTIVADYVYAKRLDEGLSKQSPDGMTKPTETFIRKRVKDIFRGK
jgi:hypothetical protein